MSAIVEAAEQYSNQLWRLNNLYWIVDVNGNKVKFIPNTAQLNLYEGLWYRNVILKARQLGFTTFIDIFALDSCLFNPNFSAGIIAHNLVDAKKIFRTKIKFPYENLPEGIKGAISARNDSAGEYVFSNKSSIAVSTSFRSGTLQLLHVSELGKIASRYPDKSREIITGAFESVPKNGLIFVESTSEGKSGDFYDIVKLAQNRANSGEKLTRFGMKLFFYAWHENPNYVLDDEVIITALFIKYFDNLKENYGITLSLRQKWWYIAKHETQQDNMKREHPSHPNEAFEVAVEGGIYTKQLAKARKEGRICSIPIEGGIEVHTFWDLGKGDKTAIWFMQRVGKEIRFIDYYQNSMEDIEHYCKVIKDKGYLYGKHYMPHDVKISLLGMEKSRLQQFEDGGVRPITVVDRIPRLIDGIQMVRKAFNSYYFDITRCALGVSNLDNYQWKWNKAINDWSQEHKHEFSDGSDALRQEAQAFNDERAVKKVILNPIGETYA